MVKVSWSLSERQHVVANGHSDVDQGVTHGNETVRRVLGHFSAGKGDYVLDLDVLQDGSRLNAGSPRLVIYESGGEYAYANNNVVSALTLCLLLAPVGTLMLIRAAVMRRQDELDAFSRAFPLNQPGPQSLAPMTGGSATAQGVAGAGKFSKNGPTPRNPCTFTDYQSSPPGAARAIERTTVPEDVYDWTDYSACLPHDSNTRVGSLRMGPRNSCRFTYPSLRPGSLTQGNPGIQPLRVRVASNGFRVRPSLYVNWELVRREDFASVLQTELNRRPPNWPVYFEGDPELEWKDAAIVIDTILGLRAEVVLLKAETAWPRKQPAPRTTPHAADTVRP